MYYSKQNVIQYGFVLKGTNEVKCIPKYESGLSSDWRERKRKYAQHKKDIIL